jgi:hypothetical protein
MMHYVLSFPLIAIFLGLRCRQRSEEEDEQERIKCKYQTVVEAISILLRMWNYEDEGNNLEKSEMK